MMGFRPGPIVDGSPTPIPQTVCLGCKVEVEQDASVPPPVGGYGFRETTRTRTATSQGPSQTWSFGSAETFNVVKAARERLRTLKQNLKLAAEWKREHDELERLLKAAKGDRKAIVRSIRSAG